MKFSIVAVIAASATVAIEGHNTDRYGRVDYQAPEKHVRTNHQKTTKTVKDVKSMNHERSGSALHEEIRAIVNDCKGKYLLSHSPLTHIVDSKMTTAPI